MAKQTNTKAKKPEYKEENATEDIVEYIRGRAYLHHLRLKVGSGNLWTGSRRKERLVLLFHKGRRRYNLCT